MSKQAFSLAELNDLPIDVFDMFDSNGPVEQLTSGHGITELGASNCTCGPACHPCCSFCCCEGCCQCSCAAPIGTDLVEQ